MDTDAYKELSALRTYLRHLEATIDKLKLDLQKEKEKNQELLDLVKKELEAR